MADDQLDVAGPARGQSLPGTFFSADLAADLATVAARDVGLAATATALADIDPARLVAAGQLTGWPPYQPGGRLTRVYDDPVTVGPYPEETSRRLWAGHQFGVLGLA